MLFADPALAARIEAAECDLVAATCAAVEKSRGGDVMAESMAGGIASWAGPNSPMNKVAGLGFAGCPEPAALDRLETAFHERGCAVQVELSNLADPAIGATLTGRGYRLVGYENVLGRAVSSADIYAPVEGVEIRETDADDFGRWLEVVVTGFATPDTGGLPSHEDFPREAVENAISDMAAAGGLRHYLAVREDEPAGAASLRLCAGVAQLCGSATLPEHRRHGIQTAFLSYRLAEAGRAGCDLAVVTTQPGLKSQQNVQRRGFELLYTRAILVLDRDA